MSNFYTLLYDLAIEHGVRQDDEVLFRTTWKILAEYFQLSPRTLMRYAKNRDDNNVLTIQRSRHSIILRAKLVPEPERPKIIYE
jgi:CRP-like cAMP-binding protein